MKIHRKHISIPASFMCVRNTIGKFCYSNWSGDVQNLAPPLMITKNAPTGTPCHPPLQCWGDIQPINLIGAYHPTLKQGGSRGIVLGNGGQSHDQEEKL